MSGNSIKRIQNLEKNINLYHLDLSDNRYQWDCYHGLCGWFNVNLIIIFNFDQRNLFLCSIVKISNLRSLTKLRVNFSHLTWYSWINHIQCGLIFISQNYIKRVQNCLLFLFIIVLFIILQTLLLHGNLISSLKNITENVSTSSLVTLSLEDNEILDLNEVDKSYLIKLSIWLGSFLDFPTP